MEPPWPFAVLHHTGAEPAHFDLLIAVPGEERLRTWRIDNPPESWPQTAESPQPIVARRIADHRQIYLSYEGEISAGRGSVRRVAQGTAELISRSENAWHVQLRAPGWQSVLILPLEITADSAP